MLLFKQNEKKGKKSFSIKMEKGWMVKCVITSEKHFTKSSFLMQNSGCDDDATQFNTNIYIEVYLFELPNYFTTVYYSMLWVLFYNF
jgi:hypothetical protein